MNGKRVLELNMAFGSTWANGLKQRKEATEVALLAVVNIGGINWQPFGQRHITSILRALYGLMLHHLLTPFAHKAFHTRKLRQFSGSGKSF